MLENLARISEKWLMWKWSYWSVLDKWGKHRCEWEHYLRENVDEIELVYDTYVVELEIERE